MGNTIKHPAGAFCWAELSTSDTDGAKKFYTELLGWTHHDDPIPGGGVYTMLRLGDGDIGALFGLTDEMKSMGVPPNWLGYVTVDDAAATAARAKSLGGTVIKDAFDVMDVGAMAVIQDPTGAVFAVWQPKQHTGSDYNDQIYGNFAKNTLVGGNGNDYLSGNGGNDVLLGGNGNDTLIGGAGNDFLAGGAGADTLTGGAGADTFYATAGEDTITDFNAAEGDTVVWV